MSYLILLIMGLSSTIKLAAKHSLKKLKLRPNERTIFKILSNDDSDIGNSLYFEKDSEK